MAPTNPTGNPEPIGANPGESLFIPQEARCLRCDYQLHQLTSPRCPECGQAFDPSDPRSYNVTGRAFPVWARVLLRPPGIVVALAWLIPTAFSLWESRRPGGDFGAVVGGLGLWILIAPFLLLRCLLFFGIGSYFRRPTSETSRRWILWWLIPIGFGLWLLLGVSGGDLAEKVAFALSETHLKAIAVRQTLPTTPTRAGVLEVTRADAYADGVLLLTGPGYDGWAYGYAYFPHADPSDADNLRFYHAKGRWWTYWDGRSARYAAAGSPPPAGPPPATQPAGPAVEGQ